MLILSDNVVSAFNSISWTYLWKAVFHKTYSYWTNSAEYFIMLSKAQVFCKHLNISLKTCKELDLDCIVLFSITDKAKRHSYLSYRMVQHRQRKCSHRRIHCISLYIFHRCDIGYHSCYNVQDSLVQLRELSLLSLPGQGPFHSTVMNGYIPKILSAWMLSHLK